MTAELSAIKKRIFQVEADSKTRDLSLRREYNTKLRQHRHAQSSALGGGGGHDGVLEIKEIPSTEENSASWRSKHVLYSTYGTEKTGRQVNLSRPGSA